jgi:hypothetical protein
MLMMGQVILVLSTMLKLWKPRLDYIEKGKEIVSG